MTDRTVWRRRGLSDLAAAAEAFIRSVGERLERPLIRRRSGRLDNGRLIESQAQRRQVGTLLLCEARTYPRAIQILDPQQEPASRRPGEQPGQNGGAEIANMKLAGRARCVPSGAVHGTTFALPGTPGQGW